MAVPAPLESTLNLVFHFAIFAFVFTGFTFARRRKYNIHEKWMFTAIVLVAISFFAWMAPSYIKNLDLVVKDFYSVGILLTNIHVVFGVITGCLALYIVALMKLNIPDRYAVKNVRRLMRTTFVLWLVTFLVGLSFYIWYFVI